MQYSCIKDVCYFFKLSDNKPSVLSDFPGFNLLMANLTCSTVIQ